MAAAATPSDAVIQLYREACLSGELRLSPERGSVVPVTEVPSDLRGMGFGSRLERATYVKMKEPTLTYVIMQWYSKPAPGDFRYDCSVASRNWTVPQAGVAFYSDTPKATAQKMWVGDWWYIDEPKAGFRKDLHRTGVNWLVLSVSEYAPKQ